jgi:hypothetical protein
LWGGFTTRSPGTETWSYQVEPCYRISGKAKDGNSTLVLFPGASSTLRLLHRIEIVWDGVTFVIDKSDPTGYTVSKKNGEVDGR